MSICYGIAYPAENKSIIGVSGGINKYILHMTEIVVMF